MIIIYIYLVGFLANIILGVISMRLWLKPSHKFWWSEGFFAIAKVSSNKEDIVLKMLKNTIWASFIWFPNLITFLLLLPIFLIYIIYDMIKKYFKLKNFIYKKTIVSFLLKEHSK